MCVVFHRIDVGFIWVHNECSSSGEITKVYSRRILVHMMSEDNYYSDQT